MNKTIRITFAILFSSFSINSNGDSLQEIAEFTKLTCDELEASGSITRKKIDARIQGDLKGIAKLLGASVGANGEIAIEEEEYDGIPYYSISEQMKDSRQCRKELSKMLIEERNEIAKIKEAQEPQE